MSDSQRFVSNDERLGLEVSVLITGLGPARTMHGIGECSTWCPTQVNDANVPHDIECVVPNSHLECSNEDCSEEAAGRKTFGNGVTAWLCQFDLAVGEPCAECGGGSAGVRISVNGEDGGLTSLDLCYEHADRWTCEVEVDGRCCGEFGCPSYSARCNEYAVYRDRLGYIRCREHISAPLTRACEAGQADDCKVDEGKTVRVRLVDAVTEIWCCEPCRDALRALGELDG